MKATSWAKKRPWSGKTRNCTAAVSAVAAVSGHEPFGQIVFQTNSKQRLIVTATPDEFLKFADNVAKAALSLKKEP